MLAKLDCPIRLAQIPPDQHQTPISRNQTDTPPHHPAQPDDTAVRVQSKVAESGRHEPGCWLEWTSL